MFAVIHAYEKKIDRSQILKHLNLRPHQYIVVSCHREENVDDAARLAQFVSILNNLGSEFKLPVIVSTHPRTKKRLEEANLKADKSVKFLKPFGFTDYIKLQQNARIVLSDSGTITE